MATRLQLKNQQIAKTIFRPEIIDKDFLHEQGCECWRCPLKEAPYCPSTGPQDAKFAIVGIAPHTEEIKAGEPFVGPSGDILNTCLKWNDLDRSNFLITNQVLCQPFKGTTPPDEAVICCEERLRREISGKLVVAMGGGPAKELMGVDCKISDVRGQWFKVEDSNYWVLPTYHPAYALRTYPEAVLDIRNDLYRIITGPYVEPGFEYYVLDNLESIQEVVNYLLQYPNASICVDIETTNEDMIRSSPERWWEGYILCTALYKEDDTHAFVIDEAMMQQPETLVILRPLLEREKGLVGANFKFDVLHFKKYYSDQIEIKIEDDTFIMSYSLDERPGGHSLKDHGALFDDRDYDREIDEYVGFGKDKKSYSVVPRDVLYRYAAKDVVYAMRIRAHFQQKLIKEGLYNWPYHNVILRAQQLFIDVERFGVYTYQDKIQAARETVLPRLERVRSRLRELLGNPDFNPGSSSQVSEVLYKELKLTLPRTYKTKNASGISSDDKALVALLDTYPDAPDEVKEFITGVQEYRKMQKLLTSYIEKLPEAIDQNSWSHYGYNLGRVVTGRLSGSIIMTLPADTEFAGPLIRGCFGAPDSVDQLQAEFKQITLDWLEGIGRDIEPLALSDKGEPLGEFVLIDADFSQAEVRTAGWLSQDENIILVYEKDEDIHGIVAEAAFGPGWGKNERRIAKSVVFGSMYGATVETLTSQGVPRPVAQQAFERFCQWAWQYDQWRKYQFILAKTVGELQTPTGRKRRFPLVSSNLEWHIRNQAYNFSVQSLANDVALTAFANISAYCKERKLPIFPTIYLHDGLYFICYNDRLLVEWAKKFVLDTMTQTALQIQTLGAYPQFDGYKTVPFKAELDIRRAWAYNKAA